MTEVPERVREAYREAPSGWKLEKLKFFANIRNSNVDKTISEDEEPVRLCNYTDVYYNDCITSDLHFTDGSATEAEIERFQLKRGQVIVTKDSEAWDDIGIPALVSEDMAKVLCGYHLAVLEPGPGLDGGFLAWLCRAEPLNDQFKLAANGVTRFGLGQHAMKNVFIAVPPLDTQRYIARFLDEKTAQIAGLIERKRELLDRLAEKRRALITRAVTNGLNANVPSSRPDRRAIERLGGMMRPPSWAAWKLSHAYRRIGSGTTPTSSDARYYTNSGGTPWVTTAELRENVISVTKQQVTQEALEDFPALRMYKPGSVMMAMYGATIGRLGMTEVVATCNQACCVFEASNQFDNRFLFYWLWHRRGDLVARSVGGGQPNLSQYDLREERAFCPPLHTQRRIARFLDEETARIDGLGEKLRDSIVRLEEYRSALVTAAVTGQLGEIH